MKYVISAILYIILFTIVVGCVDFFLIGDFMGGAFPTGDEALMRYILRAVFVTYFTISSPIKLNRYES